MQRSQEGCRIVNLFPVSVAPFLYQQKKYSNTILQFFLGQSLIFSVLLLGLKLVVKGLEILFDSSGH